MSNIRDKVVLTLLIIVLFSVQVFVTYRYLTSIVPGANDFYSRWAGARALLLEGRDPYGLDVTYEIQEDLVPVAATLILLSTIKVIFDINRFNFHLATSTVVLLTLTFQTIVLGLIADLVVSLHKS